MVYNARILVHNKNPEGFLQLVVLLKQGDSGTYLSDSFDVFGSPVRSYLELIRPFRNLLQVEVLPMNCRISVQRCIPNLLLT